MGTLPVTSTAGKDVFSLSFPLHDFKMFASSYCIMSHDTGRNVGFFTTHSSLVFPHKEAKKKKQQINIHTLSKQTDCCLAEVLITSGIQVISFPQCGPRPS